MMFDRSAEKLNPPQVIKFGGGFYCGKLIDGNGESFYTINAFYLNMRAVYTTAPSAVHYFNVKWPASKLSWKDFRSKLLGATNPSNAALGSIPPHLLFTDTE